MYSESKNGSPTKAKKKKEKQKEDKNHEEGKFILKRRN